MIGSRSSRSSRSGVRSGPQPGDRHYLIDDGQGRAPLVEDRHTASRARYRGDPAHDERDHAALEEPTCLLPQGAARGQGVRRAAAEHARRGRTADDPDDLGRGR
jgi:hypothetical protein